MNQGTSDERRDQSSGSVFQRLPAILEWRELATWHTYWFCELCRISSRVLVSLYLLSSS